MILIALVTLCSFIIYFFPGTREYAYFTLAAIFIISVTLIGYYLYKVRSDIPDQTANELRAIFPDKIKSIEATQDGKKWEEEARKKEQEKQEAQSWDDDIPF